MLYRVKRVLGRVLIHYSHKIDNDIGVLDSTANTLAISHVSLDIDTGFLCTCSDYCLIRGRNQILNLAACLNKLVLKYRRFEFTDISVAADKDDFAGTSSRSTKKSSNHVSRQSEFIKGCYLAAHLLLYCMCGSFEPPLDLLRVLARVLMSS